MRGKKKSFPEKIRKIIFERQGYICGNSSHEKCLYNKGLSIHHIIANTELNAKLYGDDFLQSAENGIVLCDWCHNHQAELNFLKKKKESLILKLNKKTNI